MSSPGAGRVGCHGCKHFLVTYDVDWPYVCERFELRSRRLPSIEVEEASGQPCMGREARHPAAERRMPQRRPDDGLYA